VEAKDLPGISLAWVTTEDPLPNGNEIFGNDLVAAKVIRDRK
jgi:hypothetical protein